MSVNGRIRAFEKQIQRNKHNINIKSFQQNVEKYKTGANIFGSHFYIFVYWF